MGFFAKLSNMCGRICSDIVPVQDNASASADERLGILVFHKFFPRQSVYYYFCARVLGQSFVLQKNKKTIYGGPVVFQGADHSA